MAQFRYMIGKGRLHGMTNAIMPHVMRRAVMNFISCLPLALFFCVCQRDDVSTVRLAFSKDRSAPIDLDTIRYFEVQSGQYPPLTGIGKIERLSDGGYLILGGPLSTLYRADSTGTLRQVVASTGEGPTGFPIISDFCVASTGKIYIITDNPVQVGEFDAQCRYVRRLTLPWMAGESIQECNDGFIIGSMVVYDPSKPKGASTPLSYSDRRFLVRYDEEFKNYVVMLGPCPELAHTDGLMILPHRKFTPFVVTPDMDRIWAITQEGFYRIEEMGTTGRHIKRFEIGSAHFVPVRPQSMVDFKKVGYDQALHGRLIASHSAPTLFLLGKSIAILRMNRPYENYYPQYCREPMPKYYYDLFSIQSGSLVPLYEGLETDLWLIGVEKGTDTFYFTKLEFEQNEISPPKIYAVSVIPKVAA